jgi:hypothetical protein
MKKMLKAAFLLAVLTVAVPSFSNPFKSTRNVTERMDPADVQKLENRLKEISTMDIESMSRAEKKAMKKEVKAIKKKMDSNGGIYISAGAVILIIVLLIILL